MSSSPMSQEFASPSHSAANVAGNEEVPARPSRKIISLLDDSPDVKSSSLRERSSATEAATTLTASFVQMLQFEEQKPVFARHAKEYLSTFASYYQESKIILKAKSDSVYCPPNCRVTIPFQPLKRIQRGAACQALVNEITAATGSMNTAAGKLYLRGKVMNNDARKAELIEIFA